MDPTRFDALTKMLSTARSRRGLLRTLGAALGAAGLAARGAPVRAAKGGNSACAHFCAATFGADTPAANQCTSDAAHGTGLCYSCAGPRGHGCSGELTCQHGECVCTGGETGATCSANSDCCSGNCIEYCGCCPSGCTCAETIIGTTAEFLCVMGAPGQACGGPGDGPCPAGQACVGEYCQTICT